jgi:hypothetical protein
MNPFNNRWLALFVVVGFLLIVAELVGTGEHGGVLSQAAQSYSAGDGTGAEAVEAPPPETIPEPPIVIEEVPEDVPEEDMPQIVMEDDVEDGGDLSMVDDFPEPEMAADAPLEDGPGEEYVSSDEF